jgi:hypothetical protein
MIESGVRLATWCGELDEQQQAPAIVPAFAGVWRRK